MSSVVRFPAAAIVAANLLFALGLGCRPGSACLLREAKGPSDSENVVTVRAGDRLRATCHLYIGNWPKGKVISAGATIENPTDKTLFYEYYVAFFDGDGKLVGCARQGSSPFDGLAPGKLVQLGSCLIHVPQGELWKIRSHQVTLYESEIPVEQQRGESDSR